MVITFELKRSRNNYYWKGKFILFALNKISNKIFFSFERQYSLEINTTNSGDQTPEFESLLHCVDKLSEQGQI